MASILTTPEYSFPHTEVNIYDNSEAVATTNTVVNGTKMLFVINSPRGIDGKLQTISGGINEFKSKFGMGSFSKYGQPLLNAYSALMTGVVEAQVLRVVAKNSRRANIYVYAAYKSESVGKSLSVKFLSATDDSLVSLDDLGSKAETLKPTEEGYTVVFLFAVAALGRGSYGNNLGVRLSSYNRFDRANEFKNYTLDVYENDVLTDTKRVSMYEEAINGNTNLFMDSVANDPATGCLDIATFTNPTGFATIAAEYKKAVLDVVTDEEIKTYATSLGLSSLIHGSDVSEIKALMQLSEKDFDVLLGINKNLVPKITNSANTGIYHYTIDAAGLQMNEFTGFNMKSGADGDFVGSNAATALNRAYLDAFSPMAITEEELKADALAKDARSYDTDIYSSNKFPLDIILDANYSNDVKKAISALATARGDCMAMLDIGTGIKSKSDVLDRVAAIDASCAGRLTSVDAYQCKVRDPYSKNVVAVTSTYLLASAYPAIFSTYGGKHVPLAGGAYGVLTGAMDNTIYPIFDEDLDAVMMTQMVDYRVNYAQINPKGVVTRATQYTRQEKSTNLSEISNMMIVLDIKRDVEYMVSRYGYNFNDSGDMARFNRDAEALLTKYSGAQVSEISAIFDADDIEADQGILHLSINMKHKKLIKISMVDINVNR